MKFRLAPVIAAAWLATAPLAMANDMPARITAGRAANGTPLGAKYGLSLPPLLGAASQSCDPPGLVLPAPELGRFVLVGTITKTGRLTAIETHPHNALTACYAAALAAAQFAPPPHDNYPLLIQLNVTN
jgi:hypothetical protein